MKLERATIWNIYFFMNAVGAGLSVFLYLLVPAGSVQYFGGDYQNGTAASWCSIVGAGDFLVSYLAWLGFLTRQKPASIIRTIAMFGIGMYSILHGGAFLFSHFTRNNSFSLPNSMIAGTFSMVIFGLFAVIDSGYIYTQTSK